jgi:hypothetical protein
MPSLTMPALRDAAADAWQDLCGLLAIPAPVGQAVWRALCGSRNAEALAIRYHLGRIARAGPFDQRRAWCGLLYGPGYGPRLVALLEDFARSGRLSRAAATTAQEALLTRMGDRGQWTAP